jgi:hypothetical protein
MAKIKKNKMDLLAVTYVKCEKGEVKNFKDYFKNHFINEQKPFRCGIVKPTKIASAAGHFDYIVIIEANSVAAISQFCLDVLRSSKRNGLGRFVQDTQTSIGVIEPHD